MAIAKKHSHTLDSVKKRGLRITTQRKQILATLTHTPQSVTQIGELLSARGQQLDQATIYRTLECFVELNMVTKTQFKEGVAVFELQDEDYHHHHLVCESCGSIEDVSLDEEILFMQVKKHSNFQIKTHSLEFFGICSQCQ